MTLGLGDLAASDRADDRLVTTGLGSCVAVVLRGRRQGVAALAHIVLPGPRPPGEPGSRPAWYADTGVRRLLGLFREVGGQQPEVLLVGGARAVDGLTHFDIGHRNVLAVRRELWRFGLVPVVEEVEGTVSRSVTIDVGTGQLCIRSPGVDIHTHAHNVKEAP